MQVRTHVTPLFSALRGITPPSPARPRRLAEGLRLALLSQPGLACLQLEGLSPPGALQGGLHPELRGRERSWCRGDRSRQLPVGNRNCQVLPSLRGDPETAGPEALQPCPACHPPLGRLGGATPLSGRQAPASTPTRPLTSHHTTHPEPQTPPAKRTEVAPASWDRQVPEPHSPATAWGCRSNLSHPGKGFQSLRAKPRMQNTFIILT